MEWPQTYFEMVYKIIREQNKEFLKEISKKEMISYEDLTKEYVPSRKHLKEFIHRLHCSQD
jgi:hypothetical protein